MYLINTQLTLNWYLLTGANPPALADLDIHVTAPDMTSTYYDAAIASADYTQSTSTTKGLVVWRFTPDQEGLWKVTLTNGSSGTNTEYYTHEIPVGINDTSIQKFIKSNLL